MRLVRRCVHARDSFPIAEVATRACAHHAGAFCEVSSRLVGIKVFGQSPICRLESRQTHAPKSASDVPTALDTLKERVLG